MSLAPDTEFLNLLEFCELQEVFCPWHWVPNSLAVSQVVEPVELQITSGWGLAARKTKPWLDAYNFQPHSPQPPGKGEGLETEVIIDYVYVTKPP